MRRLQPLGALILIPAVCLFLSAPGCGKKEEPPTPPKKVGGTSSDGKQGGVNKGKGGEPTELATTDWGTLSGTVTYDGTPPTPKMIDMSGNPNEKQCHETKDVRELETQTWLVDPKTKGVSDVIVFVKPPEGKYFKIHPSYFEKAKKPVLLHQPHCTFIPHSFAYWASYYDKDTKDQKPSGKMIEVLNDAHFNHNTAWSGDEDVNPKGSVTLAPEKDKRIKFAAQDTPIHIKCDIHRWMSANCWALDNPYAARTDKDGKFKIENVPAGAEVYVVGWHEGAGFFNGGPTGKAQKLEKGENTLDFKIKAK